MPALESHPLAFLKLRLLESNKRCSSGTGQGLIYRAEDVLGEKMELRYYRDNQGHEVDFCILHKREPVAAIEVKSTQQDLDQGLNYLLHKKNIPYAFQIHLKGNREYQKRLDNGTKVWFLSIERFLTALV